MTWTITGRVHGIVTFPDHPDHVGQWGLVGGEDVWVQRATFRSTTEAARWCERILLGQASRPRWQAEGQILDPHTPPAWHTADVVAASTGPEDDIVFRWNGESWDER